MKPPSDKQLKYLRALGYTGKQPESSFEASQLIGDIKDGMSSNAAEKNAKKHRREAVKRERKHLQHQKQYLDGLESMMAESEGVFKCAGFRMKAIKGETSEQHLIYDKAFLPFDVAKRHPELLGIRDVDHDELQRKPSKGKIVQSPGVVKDMADVRSTTGCLVVLCLVVSPFVGMIFLAT